MPAQYKSRLVVRGDLEHDVGVRTDSPTCESEGLRLIMSFAAGTKSRLRSADITSAYFQGMELDRLMLLKPPLDGLEGVDADGCMIARMPVWKKLRMLIRKRGLRESRIMTALFSLQNSSGELVVWLGTHVDDLLWTVRAWHEDVIGQILKEFDVKEIHEGSFRYCGLDIEQGKDYSVKVSAKDNCYTLFLLLTTSDRPLIGG